MPLLIEGGMISGEVRGVEGLYIWNGKSIRNLGKIYLTV